jgi:hypothetical protein
MCAWSGEATCLLEIKYSGTVQDKILTQPGLSEGIFRDRFEGYQITFTLEPYPSIDEEIKEKDYRLKLIIDK